MMLALAASLAVASDALLGEPRRWHPLVGFGWMAGRIEQRLNPHTVIPAKARSAYRRATLSRSPSRGQTLQNEESLAPSETLDSRLRGNDGFWREPICVRLRGTVALLSAIAPLTVLCAVVVHGLRDWPMLAVATEVAILYLAIGHRSLREHALAVHASLHRSDLAEARQRIGYMVSRETDSMDAPRIAAATVESVLENGSDAIFGALFWFLIAGAPGALAYRLVNTLDAMWGYRTPRHLHFGWAAARLDDVLNWAPARLAALSYALLGASRAALYCWRTQAAQWDSPNGGPVMAAGAGALGLQLGGAATYHCVLKQRPTLGAGRAAEAHDIPRSLRLVLHTLLLWLALLWLAQGLIAGLGHA